MARRRETETSARPGGKSGSRRATNADAARPEARGHAARTRQDHSQELAQDYVELIADLIERAGEARVVDLAKRLGVTHVTVNRAIQRLQRGGLVATQPYRAIFLTTAGQRLAVESRERHDLVVRFLIAIGVPRDVAESDAEGIEHHVSRETLRAFRSHLSDPRQPR
jgi:DtxR family transcriptional regulator, manganese transport regulator